MSRRARLIRAMARIIHASVRGPYPQAWAVEASLRDVRGGALDVRGWRGWTNARRRMRRAVTT